jgi:hypothetical protein
VAVWEGGGAGAGVLSFQLGRAIDLSSYNGGKARQTSAACCYQIQ